MRVQSLLTLWHYPGESLAYEPEARYVGLWNEARRVTKECTEGRQVVSTGRRREQIHTCGNGMTRRDAELQSDTQKAGHFLGALLLGFQIVILLTEPLGSGERERHA